MDTLLCGAILSNAFAYESSARPSDMRWECVNSISSLLSDGRVHNPCLLCQRSLGKQITDAANSPVALQR
jgi:hypothetical protein